MVSDIAKPRRKPGRPAKRAIRGPIRAPKARAIPLDKFGLRVGSLKSKAASMYASNRGATLKEVTAKLGSPQLNFLKTLEGRGHSIARQKVKGKRGERSVTRYFLS